MISYAQNFEDVMLWRALKHVPQGFYIDVGAHEPELHSVTRWFYDQGWRGVSVEPSPDLFGRLAAARPRDTNLRMAVSDAAGTMTLAVFGETGLATLEDAIAEETTRAGRLRVDLQVDVTTLADLCARHVPEGQDTHFLKVDVEGHERQVLAGADWRRYRPWIVLAEATTPGTQVQNHEAWEPILLDAGYEFVWFDGLNRFYIARERADLRAAFEAPPNVFDGFQRVGEAAGARHESELAKTRQQLAEAERRVAEAAALRLENARLAGALAESRGTIEAIRAEIGASRAAGEAVLAELRHFLAPHAHRSRPLWMKLLFHRSGRPSRVLRKALFHASGRPRGVFRHLVLHADGRPHAPFRAWMTSPEYRSLRGAVRVSAAAIAAGPQSSLSEDARLVLRRVEAMRARASKIRHGRD